MTGQANAQNIELIEMAGEIVAAYVSHNHVAMSDLPALIESVHASLCGFGKDDMAAKPEDAPGKPTAAQIRKSVRPDGIVSFIDGKAYKTLKRHLTSHGLTPDSYRERYGLPGDYPMVASSYSERRSSLAKSLGLGRGGEREAARDEAPAASRGRRKVA